MSVCAYCGRDASGQRGFITPQPRALTTEEFIGQFTRPVTPDTRTPSNDVRTCTRPECIEAARRGVRP